ncbi:MAG TPA: retropepsin-like aspartic protease [Tepidisphaeraceae bacterium]|jgi:aspartyl protease family protein|nr:retropepsin-like aspartic protease [Tepidisphaeraceae bacterium]
MWRLCFVFVALIPLIASVHIFGADGAANDGLKAFGLSASASAYVLDDENDVVKEMPELRKTKKEFDADARIHNALQAKIKSSKTLVIESIKEHDRLKDRLSVITDPTAHNRLILRMNQLVIKINEAVAANKDAEELLAKHDTGPGTKYVDAVLALDAKAQDITKKYEQLAADAAVKAAVTKANRGAKSPLKLGPSPEFATAATELAKYRSDIDSEAIPLSEEGGVQNLTVLLNGETFKMTIDSGATLVTIPREMADKLNLTPGPQDPVLEMRLADGHAIQVQQMTLKTVRVGRFTVENVTCAVMAPGLKDAPALLGNSFLSHFVVKLDQKAGQLHLTEVDKGQTNSAPTGKITVTGRKTPAE